MGKSSPSPPPAPDPVKTAQAQATANKEAAIAQGQLNMVNQVTPYGSLEYTQRGTTAEGTPQYTATQTLAPEQQQMLDLNNQAGIQYGQTANQQLAAVSDRLSQPLDFGSLGAAPVANENMRQQTYDTIIQRNQPQADRQREMLETRLANQGIGYGSEAWRSAMDDYNRGQNDFNLAAQNAALGQMGQMYGLESNARDRSVNELIQQRTQPLNELAAMLTGSQVQAPTYVNTPRSSIQPADIMGATYGSYNGAMNAYNANLQNQQAQRQGLYSLLGTGGQAAALAWSDRRLKTGIRRVGETVNGLGVYRFRYIWGGPEVEGLMADEVRAVRPDAVVNIGGYDAVNYTEALR